MMKCKIISLPVLLIFMVVFPAVFLSCSMGGGSDSSPADEPVYSQEPLEAFIRGVDASMVLYIENNGGIYKNSGGVSGDFFKILKSSGVNWVRFRLWVDPESYASTASADLYPQGLCNIETIKKLAPRAESAGLRWLLDFHYSDTWAHPGQQIVPLSWASVSPGNDMAEKISSYTYSVLVELKNCGLVPDMVQVGNEVNSGICVGKTSNTANLKLYLEAGCKAVKDFAADNGRKIKVMIHIAKGGSSTIRSFFDNFGNDYYDVIGLSWYPWYTEHGTIQELGSNIAYFSSRTGKDVIVVETSWPWTNSWKDWTANVCGKSDSEEAGDYQDTAYVLLNGYEGIKTVSGYVEVSEDNQYNVVNAIFETVRKNSGDGVFYWGGEWIAYGGNTSAPYGSTWENQALFDFNGIPLKVLDSFAE